MMSLLRKKKFKFHVEILVADLTDVPLVNAALFAKIRLLEGGSFTETTAARTVTDHHVCWDHVARFACRIPSHPHTGILDTCLCRVSVRKEVKGGKSFEKLGFIDVNLSEYTGSGVDGQSRSYLLEGYNKGHRRQDNSRLRVNVAMRLLSADPFFKVPSLEHTTGSMQGHVNPADRRAPSAWDQLLDEQAAGGSQSESEDRDLNEVDKPDAMVPSTSTFDSMVTPKVSRPSTIGIAGSSAMPSVELSTGVGTPKEYTSLIDEIADQVQLGPSSTTPTNDQLPTTSMAAATSNATSAAAVLPSHRKTSSPKTNQSAMTTSLHSQVSPKVSAALQADALGDMQSTIGGPYRTVPRAMPSDRGMSRNMVNLGYSSATYNFGHSGWSRTASDARLMLHEQQATGNTRLVNHRHSCATPPSTSTNQLIRDELSVPSGSLPRRNNDRIARSVTPSSGVMFDVVGGASPVSASSWLPSGSSNVERTRVDAEELIDDIIEQKLHLSQLNQPVADDQADDRHENEGLQLFISREDGRPMVGATSHAPNRNFERVIIVEDTSPD